MDRRSFITQTAGLGAAAVVAVPLLSGCENFTIPVPNYGPLGATNAQGLKLPAGFTSRIIATTGQKVGSTNYTFPADPDGGAVFPTADGGWIYAVNHESSAPAGGVSMIKFSSAGAIVDAKRILSGTTRNCGGGPTPWGTWLSGEETSTGQIWECDPTGVAAAVARPGMGRFSHEAAAVDPIRQHVYLTEDVSNGGLYRYAYPNPGDLSTGTLQVLREISGVLSWATVPDPDGSPTATRSQVSGTKAFNGGEGIWFQDPLVTFTTKGDNRLWAYDVVANTLQVVYDDNTNANPILTGVDNVVGRSFFHQYVAEDGGNMEIVVVDHTGATYPVVQVSVSSSEVTGPAFSPDGTRLYFNSQRNPGTTYEVTGPFV